MILMKTANEFTFFSAFYHCLKIWILNLNPPKLPQKTLARRGFLFNNVYIHVYYHPSTFVGLVAKHPVYIEILADSNLCKRLKAIKCSESHVETLFFQLLLTDEKQK